MNSNSLKFLIATLLVISVLFVTVFLPMAGVLANSDDVVASEEHTENIAIDQDFFRKLNIQVVVVSMILLFVLVFIALVFGENSKDRTKGIIFWLMASVIIFPTFFFVGTTLYINFSSITKGPVHWHADFKIVVCGQETDPVNVKGLSNKKGTNVLHEHEDRRIHVEGVVVKKSDVALDKFFEAQGGKLSLNAFTIPTNEGLRTIRNNDQCDDGQQGVWQVFLYTTDNDVARQRKLDDFVHYVPSPHTSVPPGDCIIFEFGPEKEQTDVLCGFYQLQINKGNLKIL